MAGTLDAWTVKLKFDSSAVEKGIKDLDTKFSSFNNKALSQQINLQNASAKRAGQEAVNVERVRRAKTEAATAEIQQKQAQLALDQQKAKIQEATAKKQATAQKKVQQEQTKAAKIAERDEQRRLKALAKEEAAIAKLALRDAARAQKASDRLVKQEQQRQRAIAREADRNVQSSRVQFLSPAARRAQESRIFSAQQAAGGLQGQLRGAQGAEASSLRNALTREIRELRAASAALSKVQTRNNGEFDRLSGRIEKSRQAITRLRPQVRSLSKEFSIQERASGSLQRSLGNLFNSYFSVFAALAGGAGLVQIGRDLEDTQATLLLASSSAKQAAEDTLFVSQLSDQTRIRVADLTRSYAKYAVAGRTAGLATQEIERTFTDLSIAIRATGLSQDRANLAFLGFQQILAGPVVQAQEMNQIIEQMPQFAGLAAKAIRELGFDTANYRDAVATGTVDSQKFINAVSRLLGEQARSTGAFEKSINSITGTYGGFRNELDKLVKTLFEAGVSEVLQDILSGLAQVVKGLSPAVTVLGKTLDFFVDTVQRTFAPVNMLAKALGGDDSSGLTAISKVLSVVLSVRLLGSLLKLRTFLATSAFITGIKAAGSAFLVWAFGANAAAAATTRLAGAVRVLKTVTGIGFALAGASVLFESFSSRRDTTTNIPAASTQAPVQVNINATDRSTTELTALVEDIADRRLANAFV